LSADITSTGKKKACVLSKKKGAGASEKNSELGNFSSRRNAQMGLNAHDTYIKEFTFEINYGRLMGIYRLAISQTSLV
jgi:hypothetical protein